MNTYIVKILFKDAITPMWCTAEVITPYEEIKAEKISKDSYFMSFNKANELVKHVLVNRTIGEHSLPMKYISIVRLSSYAPYPEQEVVFYKEFK